MEDSTEWPNTGEMNKWYLDLYRRREQLFSDALRRSPALADRLASL